LTVFFNEVTDSFNLTASSPFLETFSFKDIFFSAANFAFSRASES